MHFRNCHSYQGREANFEKMSFFPLENEHFWHGALQKSLRGPNEPLKGSNGLPNSHLCDQKSDKELASVSVQIRSIATRMANWLYIVECDYMKVAAQMQPGGCIAFFTPISMRIHEIGGIQPGYNHFFFAGLA